MYVPGWKLIGTVIGAVYCLLGSSMLLRGVQSAMQPFGVPETTLNSPHFADFFHFLFVHMVVLGILTVLLARFVNEGRQQRIAAWVLFAINLHYTYLDFRTSDSALGNSLYHGPGTLVPPLIDVVVTLAWLYLALRPLRERVLAAAE